MVVHSLFTFWRIVRPLLAPVILIGLVVFSLREPLDWWLHGEEKYDQEALREWIREARVYQTLPELVDSYLKLTDSYQALRQKMAAGEVLGAAELSQDLRLAQERHDYKREEIREHLKTLGVPPTKMYVSQLPLFPVIYRLSVHFDPALKLPPIVWDSELPRHSSQYRELVRESIHARSWVTIQYHLHAYTQRQVKERQEMTRRLWLTGLAFFGALGALIWIYVRQRRERERQRQRIQAEQQVNAAERLRLEEELRRRQAEHQKEEAERQALELRSQLFANIGIMAGSYAHNIKNLLVRPNDLLRRCLEDSSRRDEQQHMLQEVRQTLGTVTERLQQILQTVRRDPHQAQRVRLDLNALAADLEHTWAEMSRERWKLALKADLFSPAGQRPAAMGLTQEDGRQPLWIEGDPSHLQQALENLLFNARDATFEMRNHLRDQARRLGASGQESPAEPGKRQALIAAAAWKGEVTLRTRLHGRQVILEVADNGIGMTEEVRQRCLETHFSTKRNNALYAGLSAGMGLGLSFVQMILNHHRATLEIESAPLQGATIRLCFPLAD